MTESNKSDSFKDNLCHIEGTSEEKVSQNPDADSKQREVKDSSESEFQLKYDVSSSKHLDDISSAISISSEHVDEFVCSVSSGDTNDEPVAKKCKVCVSSDMELKIEPVSLMSLTSPRNVAHDETSSDDEDGDDETTIALEEEMEPEMDPKEEIRLLSEDLDINLDELLSRSRYRPRPTQLTGSENPPNESTLKGSTSSNNNMYVEHEEEPEPESELKKFYMKKVISSDQSGDEEGEDEEYKPLKQINSVIRVGSQFQAEMREPSSGSASPPEDELMWKPPKSLTDDELSSFEYDSNKLIHTYSVKINMPEHVKKKCDSTLALQCLMESGYMTRAALDLLKTRLNSLSTAATQHVLNMPSSSSIEDDYYEILKTSQSATVKKDGEDKNINIKDQDD